jgi:hypothetical protein
MIITMKTLLSKSNQEKLSGKTHRTNEYHSIIETYKMEVI